MHLHSPTPVRRCFWCHRFASVACLLRVSVRRNLCGGPDVLKSLDTHGCPGFTLLACPLISCGFATASVAGVSGHGSSSLCPRRCHSGLNTYCPSHVHSGFVSWSASDDSIGPWFSDRWKRELTFSDELKVVPLKNENKLDQSDLTSVWFTSSFLFISINSAI